MGDKKRRARKPEWFKVTYDSEVGSIGKMMEDDSLHTVCKEANCPNRGECYKKRTVTFMIMGNQCSRNCKFCNVTSATPSQLDPLEPLHVAQSVKKLDLKHVVITSVTRDDLEDGGAKAEWTTFELPFNNLDGKSYDMSKSYKLAIVCSSSKDGAAFKGAVNSTLIIDELEVIGE